LTGFLPFIERFDNGANGHGRVVAMQKVEVEVISSDSRQRVVEVGCNIERRYPAANVVMMRALGKENHFFAIVTLRNPFADGHLAVLTIDVCRINGSAALLEDGVEQRISRIKISGTNGDRALHEPGDGFVDAGKCAVIHAAGANLISAV